MVCFNYTFYERVISDLKKIVSTCIIEYVKKEDINTIIEKEKNDWDQYYLDQDDDTDDQVEREKREEGEYDIQEIQEEYYESPFSILGFE